MTHGTSQPATAPTPAQPSDAVTFYWLATIQTDDGLQITCDGTIGAIPGTHTRASTTKTVIAQLKERHGGLTILFLSLEPNEISAPAVTQ